MNYIKVTYPVGSSFIKSTFEDNSSYIRTSVNSTFIKVSYDGGSSGLDAERLRTKVYNVTGATLTKGTVVYINGSHGNLPSVTKAIATGDATSAQTLGLVMEDILDNKSGYIIIAGKLSDLDTQAFADGAQLYLSSTVAGTYTTTKQYAPAHLVYVGIVNRSHPTQGEIEVKIQNGYEADEIHDFAVRNPLNNQGIFFNSTTNLWEKKYVSDALGYTPANASTTLTINGVTFDLSQNRSWTIAAGISGSGTSGQVSYWTGASSLGGSNNLFWDAANNRLGIGTTTPAHALEVTSSARFASRATINTGTINAMVLSVGTTFTGNLILVQGGNGNGYVGIDGTGAWGWNDGSLTINANTANKHVIIGAQGVEIARFTSGKNILVNTTADDGVNKLQVSGSAKFTSDILVNGINIGLGAGNVASNLRFGGSALLSNTTGAGNVALGYAAMYYNTGGSNNMAIGVQALVGNSTGDNNVAVGTAALFGNTNGYNNVAIGHWAAYDSVGSLSNSVGANNIFIGYGCLGESGIESNRTWIGNASTTSTWLGGNLLVGTRTNGSAKLQVATTFASGNGLATFYDGVYTFNLGFYASSIGANRLSIYRNSSNSFIEHSSGSFSFNGNLLVTHADGSVFRSNTSSTPATFHAAGSTTVALELQSNSLRRLRILANNVNTTFESSNQTSGFSFGGNVSIGGTGDTGVITATTNSTSVSISMASLLASGATGDTYFSIGRSLTINNSALIGHSTVGGGNYAFMCVYGRPANDFAVTSNGFIGIGTSSPTVRLDVRGNALVRGSGADSASTALTVQNSASTDLFVVRNDGSGFFKRVGNNSGFYLDTNGESIRGGASGNISLGFGAGSYRGFFQFGQNHDNGNGDNWYFGYSSTALSNISTSGNNNFIGIQGNFRPTSGTASYSQLSIYPTINQTGGANGITRGLYVNPTLTSASDFRAIETTNGKIIFGNLPTSSAGLPTGTLWNDAGTLKVA